MDEHSLASLGPNGFHRIAYAEWGDRDNPRIVICMHGLTRNRHDFDYLAAHLAGEFRVVAMDVVGRGDSEWLTEKNDYRFSQYVTDAAALIARVTAPGKSNWADRMRGRVPAEPGQVDWIGTSMGGLIGMMLAAKRNTPIRRLVLNDVGPLVPWSGLVQLKGQASRQRSFETLEKVEAFLREACAGFGKLSDDQWRHMAQHGSREQADGTFVLSYDPDIMRGFGGARALDVTLGERLFEGVDLWPVWDKISCPILVLRGAESDVLTERTVRELKGRGPPARVIEFPGVGHAPALMDAAQIDPIHRFLLE